LSDLPIPIRECAEANSHSSPMYELEDYFDAEQNRVVLPLEQLKQLAIKHALDACDGNISEASVKLDISRSTMYRLLEIYNIRTENGVAHASHGAAVAVG
jgi:transcriptional regulator of acetoin/glycerol metabolism